MNGVGTTHDSNFKILNAVKKKKVGGRESTGRGKVARRPAADTIPVANNGRMMKMRGNRGVPCGAFEGGWWCHKRKVQFRLSQSAKLPLLHCLLGPAVPNNSPCSKFGKQQQKKKVGKKKKKKSRNADRINGAESLSFRADYPAAYDDAPSFDAITTTMRKRENITMSPQKGEGAPCNVPLSSDAQSWDPA